MLVLNGISTFFFKTYHYSIAAVRKKSGSTSMGFVQLVLQTTATMIVMGAMMMLMRGMMGGMGSIRGESLMFIFTGVAFFITHNQIFQAVSAMDKNDKMLPVLSVSKAIATIGSIMEVVYMSTIVNILLYMLLCFYYGHWIMYDLWGVAYCYICLMLWSISLGLIFQAITPIAPKVFKMIANIYRRIGIITSGKMIPGNLMAYMGKLGGFFLYNPLFHLIDQLRGFIFAQYNPMFSNLTYPIEMSLVFFSIAIIFAFVTSRIR